MEWGSVFKIFDTPASPDQGRVLDEIYDEPDSAPLRKAC